jgi:Cu+-exporting ATPase
MHPEIIQETPGTCPKCGMALEPQMVRLEEEEENTEYGSMCRRFILPFSLTPWARRWH